MSRLKGAGNDSSQPQAGPLGTSLKSAALKGAWKQPEFSSCLETPKKSRSRLESRALPGDLQVGCRESDRLVKFRCPLSDRHTRWPQGQVSRSLAFMSLFLHSSGDEKAVPAGEVASKPPLKSFSVFAAGFEWSN